VDVYTYLSSRRLLTPPTHAEKMLACVDRMQLACRLLARFARMGFFLFFLSVIYHMTSLQDQYLMALY